MKLNPPLFKLCRSEGMELVPRKQLNAFQAWAYRKGCICHFGCNDTGSVLTDAMGTYSGKIGTGVTKNIEGINGTAIKCATAGGGPI